MTTKKHALFTRKLFHHPVVLTLTSSYVICSTILVYKVTLVSEFTLFMNGMVMIENTLIVNSYGF